MGGADITCKEFKRGIEIWERTSSELDQRKNIDIDGFRLAKP